MKLVPKSLFSLGAMLLLAIPARAQGLNDVAANSIIPNPSTAASDDAWALRNNPAGLAFVDAFQLVGGYRGTLLSEDLGRGIRHNFDAILAFSPTAGLTYGLGALWHTQVVDGEVVPAMRFSAATAWRAGRTLSMGATLHHTFSLVDSSAGNSVDAWSGDVGLQWRFAPGFALGMAGEDISFQKPKRLRAGFSIRPWGSLLTLSADARLIGDTINLFDANFLDTARLQPALTLQIQGGGLGLSVGSSLENDVRWQGTPSWNISAGLQIDAEHAGLQALSSFHDDGTVDMAAVLRFSAESYDAATAGRNAWVVLQLNADGAIGGGEGPLGRFFDEGTRAEEILLALHRLQNDDRMNGLLLRIGGVEMGLGRALEMRDAIRSLRQAGKKVILYLDGGSDTDILIASAADRVIAAPPATLDVDGVRARMVYFGDTLERVGIRVTAIHAGAYKNAPRPFIANGPNSEEIEVQNDLLDAAYKNLTESIAKDRNLSVDEVKAIMDKGGITADEAVAAKLIDGVAYEDEINSVVEDVSGGRPIFQKRYLDEIKHDTVWFDRPKIAVIPVVGTIQMEGGAGPLGGDEGAAANAIIEAIEDANEDPQIKAIVLRVDSPGGDAYASDLIWHALDKIRSKEKHKPLVTSMGSVAASGGYYVAAGTEVIFAEPTTITGSIGVYTLLVDAEKLAADWGIFAYEMKRGALPGPDMWRGPTEAERERGQKLVEATYDRFLHVVSTGRHIDKEKLLPLAGGRVWTGEQAKNNGLVDEMGGLSAAIQRARTMAGLDNQIEVETLVWGGNDAGSVMTGVTNIATTSTATQNPAQQLAILRAWVRSVLGNQASAALIDAYAQSLLHAGTPMALSMPWVSLE